MSHNSFTNVRLAKLEAVGSLTNPTALSLTHMGGMGDPLMLALTVLTALNRYRGTQRF